MLRPFYHPLHLTAHAKELHHLFWSDAVASVGVALVQLLVPAYLLTLGYSLPEVCLFFIILYGGQIPMAYLTARLMSRVSPNVLMGVGNLLAILSYVVLLLLSVTDIPLWVPAVMRAVDKGLYYIPFHLSFSKSRKRAKGDSQVGIMKALNILAAGSAPAVGGIVASLAGIAWVYGIAAGTFLVAAIIILRGQDVAKHRRFKRSLLSRRVIPDVVANGLGSSMDVVETVVWPLIIFLLVKSYAGVGILSSVVVLTSAAVAFWTGRRADHHGERRYLKRGSWVASVTNALRLIAASAVHIFGINLLSGVGQSLLRTAFVSRFYKHADREPRLEYVWAMETGHVAGWMIFMSTLFVLASVLPVGAALTAFVIIAVPLSFGARLIR
ncbi:MAG: hypothetical protein Q8Q11_01990 [bacterium]|nr:hypothetical protein [bacterium]MDZ4248323.1 hypothetical protein [Patescibacteria group bacterium]